VAVAAPAVARVATLPEQQHCLHLDTLSRSVEGVAAQRQVVVVVDMLSLILGQTHSLSQQVVVVVVVA
jgi:hypothetical protein